MATKTKDQKPGIVPAVDHSVVMHEERPEWMKKGGTRGRENIDASDLIIPRLEIAQALSPAINASKPEYVEGLKMGDLFNNVTREVYPRPVMFVPVLQRKDWNIWRLRKEGGGFRGSFPTKAEAVEALKALGEIDKHEVIDTPQQFGLIAKADGTVERIVISMSRTKAKHSRRLNTLVEMTGEDRWNRVYAITTANEEIKGKGEFQNFVITQMGYPSQSIASAAEKFYESLTKGEIKVKVDMSGIEDDVPGAGEGGEY